MRFLFMLSIVYAMSDKKIQLQNIEKNTNKGGWKGGGDNRITLFSRKNISQILSLNLIFTHAQEHVEHVINHFFISCLQIRIYFSFKIIF